MRHAARARRAPVQRCLGNCGGVEIPRWKRFCDACWLLVPHDFRARIIEAGRQHAQHRVSALAIDAADRIRKRTPAADVARRLGERDDG